VRKRLIVGKLSIRSRQALIAVKFGYIACASGAKAECVDNRQHEEIREAQLRPEQNSLPHDSSRSNT
jgi:hypothetical protein